MQPVSRAKEKLDHAIKEFKLNLKDKTCADFGSSTGGFVQSILEQNPKTIYSIETSKNRLHFMLKDDPRVIVMDNTNAVHVNLPEKVDFISIDVGWTKQFLILPNAIKNLKDNGQIVTLVKPHYEVGHSLAKSSDKEIEKETSGNNDRNAGKIFKEAKDKHRQSLGHAIKETTELIKENEEKRENDKAGNAEDITIEEDLF